MDRVPGHSGALTCGRDFYMLDINYILQTLDKTILEKQIGYQNLKDVKGIILLKNQKKLLGSYLYVGSYSDGLRLLKTCRPADPVTMFLSAEDVNNTVLSSCGPHNVIISTLDLIDIYNKINLVLQNYLHWTSSLMKALCTGQTLPQILNMASEMIRSQIFVLNSGYKVIAGSQSLYFEEPLSRELDKNGYLSYESSLCLTDPLHTAEQIDNYKLIAKNGFQYHFYEIKYHSYVLATVLLAANPQSKGIDLKNLLIELSNTITHFLLNDQETTLAQNALCAAFIKDIVEEKLAEPVEIQNRIRFLPNPLKSFCCVVLITFDPVQLPDPPYSYIMQQLEEIFVHTNMAVYKNDIVILHTQEGRPQASMDFDYDRLDELLKRYHAYAGISNASRHRVRIRTMYMIASATIRLGRALRRESLPERMFSYEDYSMYYIVDLCAKQYMEDHHHDDLIYLIHPSIIKICRYDASHKTNLRDVLFFYLLCGCSLNRTAKIMYMHRNTVLNKLNKINEIAEIPLEDGYTQQRMIMSCLIMRYYEEYMHMTIRL